MEIIRCAFCKTELDPDHVGPCPNCGATNRRVEIVPDAPPGESEGPESPPEG